MQEQTRIFRDGDHKNATCFFIKREQQKKKKKTPWKTKLPFEYALQGREAIFATQFPHCRSPIKIIWKVRMAGFISEKRGSSKTL